MVLPDNISLLRIKDRTIDSDSSFLDDTEETIPSSGSDELIFDGEFDVQFSIIKRKIKKEVEYNVKFDLFTGKIVEISPLTLPVNDVRFGVIKPADTKLLNDLVQSNIAMNKVTVFFNDETKEFELVTIKKEHPILTDTVSHLIPAEQLNDSSPLTVMFNWITKKILVKFNSENYKK